MAPLMSMAILHRIFPGNYLTLLSNFLFRYKGKLPREPVMILNCHFSLVLLTIFTAASFGNEVTRNVDISCYANLHSGPLNSDPNQSVEERLKMLNDYCWNHEVFLVEKALNASLRGAIPFPGIMEYDRRSDAVRTQRYYKYAWLGLVLCGVVAWLPLLPWQVCLEFYMYTVRYSVPNYVFFGSTSTTQELWKN